VTSTPVRVLDNRYQLKGRIGNGGMGSVWQAYDTVLGRMVAVKQLTAGWYDGENLRIRRERVRREAIALARVEHPVVVSIHDLIYDDDDPWIVMGYVSGMTLEQIIQQRSPLGEQEVASIGLAVLHGLMACHARNVCHRDVKPANIIKDEEGTVRLVDFGIARIAGLDPLTDDSKILGTLEFLDPELFAGKHASAATDLWALAVTLYWALEDRSPFRGATMEATIAAILSKNPPEPRSQGALAALVLQMLDKKPEARPAAGAVLGVLQGVASGRSPARTRPGAVRDGDARTVPMPRERAPASAVYWPGPSQQQSGRAGDGQSANRRRRVTSLSGLPDRTAAEIIAKWPTDRAVAELLAMEENEAAGILNRCGDTGAGRLLSAITAEQPALARKFVDMVTADRRGRLLNHMSSSAAASLLALPPLSGAVRALSRAYDTTVVGALSEMTSTSAAALVTAIADENEDHVVTVLGQAAPATVAGILKHVVPASRSQRLLHQLPARFQELVAKRLAATTLTSRHRGRGGYVPAIRSASQRIGSTMLTGRMAPRILVWPELGKTFCGSSGSNLDVLGST
jgi:tRNA A-37 threonylcarbamoyl transferase component Bud32/flagellar motility protein MotE (MotC chaperone)